MGSGDHGDKSGTGPGNREDRVERVGQDSFQEKVRRGADDPGWTSYAVNFEMRELVMELSPQVDRVRHLVSEQGQWELRLRYAQKAARVRLVNILGSECTGEYAWRKGFFPLWQLGHGLEGCHGSKLVEASRMKLSPLRASLWE